MEDRYNIAVVGGGPAGYVAAIRGAQLGAKVIVFERDVVGGTCLNRGCIPTKTFLKTAEYIKHISAAHERGIEINSEFKINMQQTVKYKDKVVKTLTGGVGSLLKANKVDVIKGSAVLASENTIEANGQVYTADNIILCGGSAPSVPPIPGIDGRDVLTSTDLLNIDSVPERLCIVGGGVIGCELATVFAAFGSDVTIIEMADTVAPMFEKEVSAEISAALRNSRVKLMCGSTVQSIKTRETDTAVSTDKGEILCDKVLVAVGRKPDLSCLGSLKDKLRLENGMIAVNEYLCTNLHNIYACGDINGKMMLTHAAYHMGEIAAENCMGARRRCDLSKTPNCMYTSPEVAVVGLTEEEARSKYNDRVCVGKFRTAANGRAIAYDERSGFVKVVADKNTGELLGAQIVGYMATELINEPIAVMEGEMTVKQVTNQIVHPHPSFSECFFEACLDAQSRSIHLPPQKRN